MKIDFENAKDGTLTCKINSIYIHSSYSPQKESERFVAQITAPFLPEIIFITEPALSYICEPLRKKFPKTKLAVIRFCKDFLEYNKKFDFEFNFFDSNNDDEFEEKIFSKFGENILSYSLFFSWDSTAKIFSEETKSCFRIFKNLIEKSHAILRTRTFFEKRWIKNSFDFSTRIKNQIYLEKKGGCKIFICASGPSLTAAIPAIKKSQHKFIIALSSAIRVLIENEIFPDLCLSTDGGFWAKSHLEILLRKKIKTVVALSNESIAPKKIFYHYPILPLIYPDGLEMQIAKCTNHKFMNALRCGTVSGTAIDLAEKLSTGDIYFFGLDLSMSNGFQHAQTNALEINVAINDKKISTKETRIASGVFSNQSASLSIYEKWFKTYKPKQKIFRVIDNPKNQLGEITNLSVSEFLEKIKNENCNNEKPIFKEIKISDDELSKNKFMIEKFVNENSKSEEWLQNCFPSEYLNYKHLLSENEKEKFFFELKEKNESFTKNLCKKILYTKK